MRKKARLVVDQVKNPILTKLYERRLTTGRDGRRVHELRQAARSVNQGHFPIIQDALDRKANILLEGAQATMLDWTSAPIRTSRAPTPLPVCPDRQRHSADKVDPDDRGLQGSTSRVVRPLSSRAGSTGGGPDPRAGSSAP